MAHLAETTLKLLKVYIRLLAGYKYTPLRSLELNGAVVEDTTEANADDGGEVFVVNQSVHCLSSFRQGDYTLKF
jgi:hypothetical protein